MYNNDESVDVESDLVNSYAWDTAIVFIQAMGNGNENYANKTSVNSDLTETGTTGDVACNIHDMASNMMEYTTEASTQVRPSGESSPCVSRGGSYIFDKWSVSNRSQTGATDGAHYNGFRVVIYIKNVET